MDTMELMAKFADPETLKALTITQKMMAGLITTMLGMGITFLALIILQFVIALMARLSGVKAPAVQEFGPQPQQTVAAEAVEKRHSDEQLVAAITVALAVQLGTAAGNIVIRNIRKVEDHSPAWNKVGLTELMNNNS